MRDRFINLVIQLCLAGTFTEIPEDCNYCGPKCWRKNVQEEFDI
jgi:hypothetical protein